MYIYIRATHLSMRSPFLFFWVVLIAERKKEKKRILGLFNKIGVVLNMDLKCVSITVFLLRFRKEKSSIDIVFLGLNCKKCYNMSKEVNISLIYIPFFLFYC